LTPQSVQTREKGSLQYCRHVHGRGLRITFGQRIAHDRAFQDCLRHLLDKQRNAVGTTYDLLNLLWSDGQMGHEPSNQLGGLTAVEPIERKDS
jgi:hypothetical protein